MWINKKQWCKLLSRNAENEFRITRLELKMSRLEGLLKKEIEEREKPLEEFVDALLSGKQDGR